MLTSMTMTMRVASRKLVQTAVAARSFHTTLPSRAVTELLMPAMSPTMTEGGVTEWKVKEGDSFSAGDVLLELSTDKATIDCEAQDDGIMGKILVSATDRRRGRSMGWAVCVGPFPPTALRPGNELGIGIGGGGVGTCTVRDVQAGTSGVQVGSLIALLAEEGDDISNLKAPSSSSSSPSPPTPQETLPQSEPTPKSAPSAPSVKATSTPSSPSPSPQPHHVVPKHSRPLLPSVARQLALAGIEDASVIKATGFKGMLSKGDVLAYLGKIDHPLGSEKGKGKKVDEAKATTIPAAPPKKEMDAPTLRRLIAVGLQLDSTTIAPESIVHDTPRVKAPDFDSVLDQYLPPAQRSTSRKGISHAAPLPKKDGFDSVLGL
ncbi:BQ2448_5783 [Microbotryum intermedium]|uniref:BQ2448_5783 protein n=1 Tax=Microbotryum intermedium TaxID=269621 RepID=A0A238F273_9BASI|nr:BQ2448_5783 [Microbotryum intermedium]